MRSARTKHMALGAGLLGVLAGLAVGTAALYQNAFADVREVTVLSDRAGLTMDSGAVVKVRGVEIGSVADVRATKDGAEIELRIDADRMGLLPAEVTAQIVPPTAFGQKYVQLTPAGETGTLAAGTVIQADYVTTEVDEAFSSLSRVLAVARPREVAGALTAVADTVDTRGERINRLVEDTDELLARFNPALPALAEDIQRINDVLRTYDGASADLVTMLDSGTTTARTLSTRQRDLRALLDGLESFSAQADATSSRHGAALAAALRELDPTTRLLARYSPMLPCTIEGVAKINRDLEVAVGGTKPGVNSFTRLQPADPPYRAPDSLAVVADKGGPNCFGLPDVTAEVGKRNFRKFDIGIAPYHQPEGSAVEDLAQTLLGLVGGVVTSP
ncbi:MCE family protein [Nocardioides daeguensis]|uniref:MCE family protein n=1 Tax=Nocardioides daeguensis TaxID=908359 RepID=A0ABP6UW41_9ACTN|nr:MCE family protein [Nocardioides daeguensis]MBV6725567.1 MCE family protein [Nocardioides daeguensis]MCR1771427.1 MCE family protein [Nocardioides daeguensis]